MIGYVYMTTNTVNGMRYIGQHKAKFFDKKYIGSGKALLPEIKRYSRNAFVCKILCVCDSKEQLDEMERYYIAEYNAVNDPHFYNIVEGGYTGKKPTNGKIIKELWRNADYRSKHVDSVKRVWNDPDHRERHIAANKNVNRKAMWSEDMKLKQQQTQIAVWSDENLRLNQSKRMTEVWRDESMRQAQRERNIGQNNPAYGKHYYTDGNNNWIFCTESDVPDGWYLSRFSWINDGKSNKRIEYGTPIPKGWYKGRLRKSG